MGATAAVASQSGGHIVACSRDLGQCAAGVLVLHLISGATAAHVQAAQESVLAAAHVVVIKQDGTATFVALELSSLACAHRL